MHQYRVQYTQIRALSLSLRDMQNYMVQTHENYTLSDAAHHMCGGGHTARRDRTRSI